jgi:hypothetical protein
MAKGDRKFAPLFKVVLIDAWAEGDDGWTWGETYELFSFRTTSLNLKRAFLQRIRCFLYKGVKTCYGVVGRHSLGRGWYYCTDDWDVMEVRSRADNRPWYACIRETPSH